MVPETRSNARGLGACNLEFLDPGEMQGSLQERKISKGKYPASYLDGSSTSPRLKPARRPSKAIRSSKKGRLFRGLNGMFICGGFAVVCIVLAGWLLYMKEEGGTSKSKLPRALTPLPLKRVTDLSQFQAEHRERLYWGTYRSSLYLGIRARTPKSLLAGLMWLGVKEGRYALRHTCEESDGLSQYAWVRHDGSSYGRQEIVDQGVHITTLFFKSREPGSGYGGDWAVRIQAEVESTPSSGNSEETRQSKQPVSLFFYLADEEGSSIKLWPKHTTDMDDGPFAVGSAKEIGGWELHVKGKKGATVNFVGLRRQHTHNLTQLVWQALEIQDDQEHCPGTSVHQLSNLEAEPKALALSGSTFWAAHTQQIDACVNGFLEDIGKPELVVYTKARTSGRLQLPDGAEKSANIAVFQITGEAPMELDCVFVSGTQATNSHVKKRVENLSGYALTKRMTEQEEKFEKRFQSTFNLKNRVQGEREFEVGRVALSNLLGGIGYFYGQSRIAVPRNLQGPNSRSGDYWDYWQAPLYTAVPSRSFFPRGFLWDEGFHQLLISQWDRNMSKEIVAHWLDLMNIDGWIPREQILGEEARSKVPDEFVLQHTSNANPPALFLVLRKLATSYEHDRLVGQPNPNPDDWAFLERVFPRLEAWFHWFNTTQIGKVPSSYYWHGREPASERELNPKTLMSGLDDYPRASHPGDHERHVDLRCWMALAAQSMAQIARIVKAPHKKYDETAAQLTDLNLLNSLHYEERFGRYLDYGNHTEGVKLYRKKTGDPRTGYVQSEVRRLVMQPPELRLVPHFGYNSLFPLLFHILPADSPYFGNQLVLLDNELYLWTDYGLRSLATSSSLYMKRNTEHDAPYWRGPVWMNINYLVLSALSQYSEEPGYYSSRCKDLYMRLRENLIRNVVERYHESGYLWEHYDNAKNGIGKGSHPFTGWTSLILLIMGESY